MLEMRGEEAKIQVQIVKALRAKGYVPVHIPNEQAHGNAVATGQLITMGMIPGAPDLLVPLGRNRTIFMEVKAPKGRQSENQKAFQTGWCERYGYPYRIVRSAEEAIAFLEEFA